MKHETYEIVIQPRLLREDLPERRWWVGGGRPSAANYTHGFRASIIDPYDDSRTLAHHEAPTVEAALAAAKRYLNDRAAAAERREAQTQRFTYTPGSPE